MHCLVPQLRAKRSKGGVWSLSEGRQASTRRRGQAAEPGAAATAAQHGSSSSQDGSHAAAVQHGSSAPHALFLLRPPRLLALPLLAQLLLALSLQFSLPALASGAERVRMLASSSCAQHVPGNRRRSHPSGEGCLAPRTCAAARAPAAQRRSRLAWLDRTHPCNSKNNHSGPEITLARGQMCKPRQYGCLRGDDADRRPLHSLDVLSKAHARHRWHSCGSHCDGPILAGCSR